MAAPTLTTTQYVEVGTYIGQFFVPGAGTLPSNRRVPVLVGKGDRLFEVLNTPILRSFRNGETLTFSSMSPFLANLDYNANGAQAAPTRLYTVDGNEVPANKWQYLKDVNGNYTQIQILDTAYNPLTQYLFDYQTTSRSLGDSIPTVTIGSLSNVSAEIRQITTVGLYQDQGSFSEYVDYFVPFELELPDADPANGILSANISAVTADSTGTGIVDVSAGANYSHKYNRLYTLTVTNATGTTPNRMASIEWRSAPVSFGNNALPATPINPALDAGVIVLDESDPTTLTNKLLELGIVLDFDFGGGNFVVGDLFYVQGNGGGLIEADPLLSENTNQYTLISDVVPDVDGISTGNVDVVSLPSAYTFIKYNTSFRVQCISATSPGGVKTATFAWVMYGMHGASGVFTVAENVPGSDIQTLGATGVTIQVTFGANHFVADDKWDWSVKAPRSFYRGKELVRNISLYVGTVTALPNQGRYTGSYLSDTPEGRFGTWAADSSVNNGAFEINDGLRFYIRNTYLSTAVESTPSGSQNVAGDDWSVQVRSLDLLDFSLEEQVTDLISNPGEIFVDVTGAITGVVGAKYFSTGNIPDNIISLTRVSNGAPVFYQQISGTPFIRILESTFSVAYGDLQIVYQWHGKEPDPGQTYYLSGQYLRPNEMYDTPFLFLSLADVQKFLAPSTTRNDLHIGATIAFDYAVPGLFVVQVRNESNDGNYSKTDYQRAINSILEDTRSTDLVVLNSFQTIGEQLNTVNRSNDPFERHEMLTYIGAPIGTPIGSENESNSLVFYANRTFAVYGQSPAHGSRILIGSTKAQRTISLSDGTSTQVTLDGSFVACALAGLVCSFSDPKATVLFQNIVNFDFIETYTKQENALLGAAGVIFLKDLGSGVYQLMEDTTVDKFSPDTQNINQMTQKQFVTKDIRTTLTNAIIGQVFPSTGAGVALIQDILITRLRTLVSRSLIGDYQDVTGNTRSITNSDIYVVRDVADPTMFHIGYNFFLATVAKRIFGLFTVSLPGGFPQ